MERAEKLKSHLSETDSSNRKKPSAVGANGKVSGCGGKGKCVICHKPLGLLCSSLMLILGMMKKMMGLIRTPRSLEAH